MSHNIAKAKEKGNKIKMSRYFNLDTAEGAENGEKLKQKRIPDPVFKGEIIKVNDKVGRPLSWYLKNETKKPNNEKKPKIAPEVLEKYSRGEAVAEAGVKTKFYKEKQKRKEVYLQYATEQAARTELLLQEEHGFLEVEHGEPTAHYRQSDIVDNVNIQAAAKNFKLNLDFGPYYMKYTKNGRNLLLGGQRGHVAAFDWVTKRLHCEMNVMEEVADVAWLHVDTMFACAQKKWVYIYDNRGTELHCLKAMHNVNRLEFLPYHFLLASGNTVGYLKWIDISVGEYVGGYTTNLNDIRIMCQNPWNGVLCIGGGKGVVSMWSPKVREPLAKLLCHPTPLSAITVEPKGMHLITAGLDRAVRVWDIRSMDGPLATYRLNMPANQLSVSQRGVLALSRGVHVEMFTDLITSEKKRTPYLCDSTDGFVHNLRFCPYEDVLGISTAKGFQSILVPGAGEPNFDAMEDNPFETKGQKREREVHSLLEKIPPEFICLDPNEVAAVDVPTLHEKIEAKKAVFFLKPPKVEFEPRHKMKGKGGSANAARNKQIVRAIRRTEFIRKLRETQKQIVKDSSAKSEHTQLEEKQEGSNALDRFKPKYKKV